MSLSSIQQGGSSCKDTPRNQSHIEPPRKSSKNPAQDMKILNLKLVKAFDAYDEQIKMFSTVQSHRIETPHISQLSVSHRSTINQNINSARDSQTSFKIKVTKTKLPEKKATKMNKVEMSMLARRLRELRATSGLSSIVQSDSDLNEGDLHAKDNLVSDRLSSERINKGEEHRPPSQLTGSLNSERSLAVEEHLQTQFKYKPKVIPRTLGPARTVGTIKAKMLNLKDTYSSPRKPDNVHRIKDSPEKIAKLKLINSQRSTAAGSERTTYYRNTMPTLDTSPNATNFYSESSPIIDRRSTTDLGFLSPSDKKDPYKERLTSFVAKDIGAHSRATSLRFNDDQVKEIFETLRDPELRPSSPTLKLLKPKTAGYTYEYQGKRNLKRFGMYKPEVTDDEKKRFGTFLENEFVNEIIEDKYHRKFEEKKMSCFEEIRKIIVENRAVRLKYQGSVEEFKKDYEEQQKRKKKYENFRDEEINIPKDLPKNPGFEIFTSDQSFHVDNNSKPLMDPKPQNHRRKSIRKVTKSGIDTEKLDRKINRTYERALSNLNNKDPTRLEGSLKAEAILQDKYKRMRIALRKQLAKWGKLKLSLVELMSQKIFPSQPYEREGSQAFIKAAKFGDFKKIQDYIRKNKYYVYDFDPIGQTALHWAAKRGYLEICRKLVECGADVDAEDLGEKTPLYYALRGNHLECTRLLLYMKANPWSKKKTIDYRDICSDHLCLKTLSKARQLDIVLNFQSPKDRDAIFKKRAKEIFEGDTFLKSKNLLADADDEEEEEQSPTI